MQDDKHFDWPGAHDSSADDELTSNDVPSGAEVFRHWLARAPHARRRAGFDASVYTLKGYRQWKDGVDKQWLDNDE